LEILVKENERRAADYLPEGPMNHVDPAGRRPLGVFQQIASNDLAEWTGQRGCHRARLTGSDGQPRVGADFLGVTGIDASEGPGNVIDSESKWQSF
jgi:hypothetical protein